MVGGEVCERNATLTYDQVIQEEVECILPAGSGSLKGVNVIQINGLISKGVNSLSYMKCKPGEKNVLNTTLGYFECKGCEAGYYSTIEER